MSKLESGETGKAVVEIVLDDVHAGRHACADRRRIVLDAVSVDAFLSCETFQQLAVAAAKVQHARTGLDQRGDDFKISSHWTRPVAGYAALKSPQGGVQVSSKDVEIALIGDEERVVPMGRIDDGAGDILASAHQGIDDLAGPCRREAPVGGKRQHQEPGVGPG